MRWVSLSVALFAVVVVACGGNDVADPSTTVPARVATTAPGSDGSSTSTPAPNTTAAPQDTTVASAPTTTEIGLLEFTFGVASGVVEGPDRIEVSRGDLVAIIVTSDQADEVHLHGYDVFAAVGPDTPARLEFLADIPGVFELELEGAHLVVSEIEVR